MTVEEYATQMAAQMPAITADQAKRIAALVLVPKRPARKAKVA